VLPSAQMPRWLRTFLVISFFVFTAARLEPPEFHLDVGVQADHHFLQGFGPPQVSTAGSFRWTLDGAKLILHGASYSSARLALALDAGPRPVRVRVLQDGAPVGALDVARGWRSYTVDLPSVDALRSVLEAPTVEIVAEDPQMGADGQRLGVKLGDVRLTPSSTPNTWARALPRAGVLTWTLGLVAAWLLRLDARLTRARPGAAWCVGLVVLTGLVWVAALEYRNPYRSAWLLPFLPVTLSLLSLGLLLHLEGRGSHEAGPADPSEAAFVPSTGRRLTLALVAVLVLGLAMRFHQIRELPWAMWRDEARHARVGLSILRDPTYRPLYVAHADLPALGLYPFAVALHLWGIHPWSLRPVTALAGALTVLPLFALARRLTHSAETALLAAALLAVSSWHVSISRLSFATIFEPLFTLSGLWMLFRSLESGRSDVRLLWAGGAGLSFAVAFQTYHTGRLAPLLAAWMAFALFRGRRALATSFATAALVFAAAVAPVLAYAREHRSEVNQRVGEVSLLARAERSGIAPLAALDASLGRHLLMFNWRGDSNGRHHAPDRPLLDAATGLGFLAGLALLIRHRRRPEYRFLSGALVLVVLPGVLAVDGPHAGRTIGAVAFACLVAGIGWIEIQRRTALPRALLIAPVMAAGALNSWTYFVTMPVDPRVWGAFYAVETQMGVFVRRLAEGRGATRLPDVLVPGGVARTEVFRYLADGISVETFEEGEQPRPDHLGALLLLPGDPGGAPPRLGPFLDMDPRPTVLGPPFPGLATPSFTGHTLPQP
jgi:Dolichyl-phosphate-mannose-protein mannosyltransferase